MRSWLAIFLLACMPLQWSWAATELPVGGPEAAHHVASAPSDADVHAGLHTSDCGTCHHGCSVALLSAPHAQPMMPNGLPVALSTPLPSSRPADLPDRPQWRTGG